MTTTNSTTPKNGAGHDSAVRERYGRAAQQAEAALCCPVEYDPRYLEAIPEEIIQRDYGCGDPSRHVQTGDRVLDLGSGTGKICYIASQVTGETGSVIGVDTNDEMLTLARNHRGTVADAIGYANVEFRKGHIQDLALDLDLVQAYLAEHPVRTTADYAQLEDTIRTLRATRPLIADSSIDLVVSNCVLNLVRPDDRIPLYAEIHRVLARGGRAVISDIVADEDVPEHLQRDPELWSGCISGTMREDRFLAAFADAGLYGVEILERQEEPWAVVEGIEFRSLTVRAWKGKEGACLDRQQAVVYRGPWKSVTDDDGHTLYRGEHMAVCDKTFHIYSNEPYNEQIIAVPPHTEIPLDEAPTYDCRVDARRDARATKGAGYDETRIADGDCCGPEGR